MEKFVLIVASSRYDEDEDGWEKTIMKEFERINFKISLVPQDELLKNTSSSSFFVISKNKDVEVDFLARIFPAAFLVLICESEQEATSWLKDERVGIALVGFSPAYRAGLINKLYKLSLANLCRLD